MVRILVSDSSVLIEFSKRGLLKEMFRLSFEFVVPDLLFEEELIDLGQYSRDDLVRFGLGVEALDPIGVTTALSYQSRRRRLSLVDCFALALASGRKYPILTGDKSMRTFAEGEDIKVHGVLWLVDHMLAENVVTPQDILVALEAMRDDRRCHVAGPELVRRIRQLSE
jgi:predicted nucleic acid-binding protein